MGSEEVTPGATTVLITVNKSLFKREEGGLISTDPLLKAMAAALAAVVKYVGGAVFPGSNLVDSLDILLGSTGKNKPGVLVLINVMAAGDAMTVEDKFDAGLKMNELGSNMHVIMIIVSGGQPSEGVWLRYLSSYHTKARQIHVIYAPDGENLAPFVDREVDAFLDRIIRDYWRAPSK